MATPALVVSHRWVPTRTSAPAHDAGGSVYQSVLSPFGERFGSDEAHDRIVVDGTLGRETFGTVGSCAGDFRGPRGLAFLPAHTRDESRLFVCDAMNHRVQVFDGHGEFVMAFGGRGRGPGQMLEPSGIAIVRPELPGDHDISSADREPWLAVADADGRVQVLTLDGVFVGVCRTASAGTAGAAGPLTLAWEAPLLEVRRGGRVVDLIDVAAVLDPTAVPRPAKTATVPRRGLRLVTGGAA